MISGRDIIFISSIEWDFLWQAHQEIALRFAEAGNRVLYVENTGVRAPTLGDAGRVARRVRRWAAATPSRGVREVLPNIFVTSPLVLPPFGPRWRRLVNRRLLLPSVKRAARRLGMRDPVLWTYLPTDTAADLTRLLSTPRSVTVYYCGADFSQLTPRAEACLRSEEEVLRSSDLVLTICPALAERCGRFNGDVHVVPAVVNLDAFPTEALDAEAASNGDAQARPSAADDPPPPPLPRPVIGYVGGLHKFVDYDLLTEMARARPGWSWVFVGPVAGRVGGLRELPNAHLLGQRPHRELARHIRRFDVCLVPYLTGAATATVVPMKLNEYLAMGKPVVSTELPAVRDFNERHGVLLTAENRPATFLGAIEQALRLPKDERTAARRREVAALGESRTFLDAVCGMIRMKDGEKASAARDLNARRVGDTRART